MNDFIQYIKYGDLKFLVTQFLPFILWFYFSYGFYKILNKKMIYNHLIITCIFIIIWFIPFIFAILNINQSLFKYKNKIFSPTTVSLPPGIGFCFNTNVKNEDSKQGVVAYIDYKCLANNKKFIRDNSKDLLNRSYYINYSIFLIVILAFNTITKFNIFNNKIILYNIRFALLFGAMACLFPIFSPGFYIKSLWVNQLWSYFISMNTSCFMFISITILLIINNIKIF